MKPLRRAPVQGTVFALALIAAALAISLLIRPYLEPDTFLLFLLAVWLSAWYYGRIIGFVAVAVSAVTLAYFFLSGFTPLWAVPARLCFFVGLASLIVLVTAGCREAPDDRRDRHGGRRERGCDWADDGKRRQEDDPSRDTPSDTSKMHLASPETKK